jgi:hypothetical protein
MDLNGADISTASLAPHTLHLSIQTTTTTTTTMKINSAFVAFTTLQSVGAFMAQTPKAKPLVSLGAVPADAEGFGSSALWASPVSNVPATVSNEMYFTKNLDTLPPVMIQGGALRTWSFTDPELERVLVSMSTEGRHINANIKLCQGPDNTPQTMDITIGKGMIRPFKCVIETPRSETSAIFIRNVGPLEYPIMARVGADMAVTEDVYEMNDEYTLQGGAIYSVPFAATVSSVKVVLKTDGRPLRAKVELIQGPNSIKETIEIYTEDGLERPFCTIISTPGIENTVRVENAGSMEFPVIASVEPYVIEADDY